MEDVLSKLLIFLAVLIACVVIAFALNYAWVTYYCAAAPVVPGKELLELCFRSSWIFILIDSFK
jgi:hypothetical protein